MTSEELLKLVEEIEEQKCETQTRELKSAQFGCPRHLYDTLSSFSNQDDGGVIIFGVEEARGYEVTGVYDPQDLQKKIVEQCLQMEPTVRPLLTVACREDKSVVAAEIPGLDLADRPCYYQGKGRLKGSYIRVGDSDEPMTEYEVYSYEAFRKKYQDDVRPVPRASLAALDEKRLRRYVELLRDGKPKLASLEEEQIYELMSITRDGQVTMSSVLLFSPFPQAYFPQLCVTAVVVPGKEIGRPGDSGERFLDNMRIEGGIPDMIEESIRFITRNMRRNTIINPETGAREDRTDYPVTAVREAVVNALLHRDYSIHTEGMPVRIIMYEDRLEIRSPGGLYGRIRADQLGKVQPDTRNPVLASALEVLSLTENRYSGIPTIQEEMRRYGLSPAEFLNDRGSFVVRFYKKKNDPGRTSLKQWGNEKDEKELIAFCRTPRSRRELVEYMGLSSSTYAMQQYVMPLVEKGAIKMTLPDKPKSPKQRFYSEDLP